MIDVLNRLDGPSDGTITRDVDVWLSGTSDISNYEYDRAIDVGVRNSQNRKHRLEFFSKLGARVRDSQLLYWVKRHRAHHCYRRNTRGRNRQPLCILAGFVSTDRGLHWNRRARIDSK